MYADIIDNLITHADAGTVNALALSCRAAAGIVRRRASSIADRVTIRYAIGKKLTAVVHRLPNGTPHGELVDTSIGVSIRWDRGQAISWTGRSFTNEVPPLSVGAPTMYGHRDTHNILCDDGSRRWIRVRGRYTDATSLQLNIDTGNIIAGDLRFVHQYIEPPWPLQGYLVDGEIVPRVIDAWVDAALATMHHTPAVVVPAMVGVWRYDSDSAVDDIINNSGIMIVRTL